MPSEARLRFYRRLSSIIKSKWEDSSYRKMQIRARTPFQRKPGFRARMVRQSADWHSSLKTRVCKVCEQVYKAVNGPSKLCQKCFGSTSPCACGCGELVYVFRNRKACGYRPQKFILGHNCRLAKHKKLVSKTLRNWWLALPKTRQDSFLKRLTASPNAKPNRPEKKLDEILCKHFPTLFKINVLGNVLLGRARPDFVNVDKKLVVEMFGEYWHGKVWTGRSRRAEVVKRTRYLKKFGFRTIVIWEKDLKDEKIVIRKIKKGLK